MNDASALVMENKSFSNYPYLIEMNCEPTRERQQAMAEIIQDLQRKYQALEEHYQNMLHLLISQQVKDKKTG